MGLKLRRRPGQYGDFPATFRGQRIFQQQTSVEEAVWQPVGDDQQIPVAVLLSVAAGTGAEEHDRHKTLSDRGSKPRDGLL